MIQGLLFFRSFLKMAAVRHHGFVMCMFGHPRKVFLVFITNAKFGWNRCSSFNDMQVLIFDEFCLKVPIHAPNGDFFLGGGFYDLSGA